MRAFQLVMSIAAMTLVGCATQEIATVRQADLDNWKGMPVEALDTHPLFSTMQMTTRITSSGVEVRNYINALKGTYCGGTAVSANCVDNNVTCNNLFYIRNGRVFEYAPTGQCMTNDSVRPEKRYLSLIQAS